MYHENGRTNVESGGFGELNAVTRMRMRKGIIIL
jgi:hypothetical protein